MRTTTLAMDLEGTLISNAVSQIPRPGLYDFLESVHSLFEQLAIYTTVPEPTFRKIAHLLVSEMCAPDWFAELPYIAWEGPTKDLRNVSPVLGSAFLLDDHRAYVHPGQERYWIEARLFASPYDGADIGLQQALGVIRARLPAVP